jgi:lactoylglutathione lyase
MEQSVRFPIRGIQHAGIPVTDIRRSEAFYVKLGFANIMEAPFDYHSETGTAVMMQRTVMLNSFQHPDRTMRREQQLQTIVQLNKNTML